MVFIMKEEISKIEIQRIFSKLEQHEIMVLKILAKNHEGIIRKKLFEELREIARTWNGYSLGRVKMFINKKFNLKIFKPAEGSGDYSIQKINPEFFDLIKEGLEEFEKS